MRGINHRSEFKSVNALLAECAHKPYYESVWSKIHRHKILNCLTAKTVREELDLPDAGRRLNWFRLENKYIDRIAQLLSLNDFERCMLRIDAYIPIVYTNEFSHEHQALKYCPKCIAEGFHSPMHQLSHLNQCLIHKCKLKYKCPKCKQCIRLSLSDVVFENAYGCSCGHRFWKIEETVANKSKFYLNIKNKIGDWLEWCKAIKQETILINISANAINKVNPYLKTQFICAGEHNSRLQILLEKFPSKNLNFLVSNCEFQVLSFKGTNILSYDETIRFIENSLTAYLTYWHQTIGFEMSQSDKKIKLYPKKLSLSESFDFDEFLWSPDIESTANISQKRLANILLKGMQKEFRKNEIRLTEKERALLPVLNFVMKKTVNLMVVTYIQHYDYTDDMQSLKEVSVENSSPIIVDIQNNNILSYKSPSQSDVIRIMKKFIKDIPQQSNCYPH